MMSSEVECEVESPMLVRDQHYDFDFDSETEAEQPSPNTASALLPAIKQPSPPASHAKLRAAQDEEEQKEASLSSSSPLLPTTVSPPPYHHSRHPRSPSPLTTPSADESRRSSTPARRLTASVVLSSAALQSLSALKQRRRVRAASAVTGRLRRDSGGGEDSGGISPATHHAHAQSQPFTVGREELKTAERAEEDDEDEDEEDEDDTERRRRDERQRRQKHTADQQEDEVEQRLPPLHSPSPRAAPHRHTSLLYASTPSPTPSAAFTLPSAAPRPRTRAASAFPSLSSHTSSSSSSLSSTLSQPDVAYIASDALQPLDQPGSAMAHVPRLLQSSDWSARFDALTSLRRLLLHHPLLFSTSTLKPLLRDVRAEVDSLRSLLAKNAINSLVLLFSSLPRMAEPELPLLLPPLLKRAGETSGAFLAEESDRALLAMAERCNEGKVLLALVGCGEKGNKVVRAQAVQWVGRVVEMRGGKEMIEGGGADAAKVLKALGVGCGEAGAGVRGWCKRGLQRVGDGMGWEELERALRRVLTGAQMTIVTKMVLDKRGEEGDGKTVSFNVSKRAVKGRAVVDGSMLSISGSSPFDFAREIDTSFALDSTTSSLSPHSTSSSASSTASASSPCKPSILKRHSTLSITSYSSASSSTASSSRSSRLSSASVAGVELLPGIVADMTSPDWRTRLHSIEAVCSFCASLSSSALSSCSALIDPVFALIQDNNGKVIIAAMQSLPALLPHLLPLLPLHPLLLRLTANLASTNITVRSLASSVLDLLPSLCDDGKGGGGVLMQGYSQCVLYGNGKVKLLVLEKIVELIASGGRGGGAGGEVGKQRVGGKGGRGSGSGTVAVMSVAHLKWAIPVCFLWPDEGRAEMKALLQKLTLLVYGRMGSDMFDPQLMLSLKLSTGAVKKVKGMLDIQ